MTNVNYKILKSYILKALNQTKTDEIDFAVDLEKLTTLVGEINLLPLPVGLTSKTVTPEFIPYLSEYFEKTNLSWFTEYKRTTVITFIDKTAIDDTAQELIDKLNTAQVEDPDDDKINDMAKLVANYPCYFATIVSYQNNDAALAKIPSYVICCRANKVVIRNSNYQYDPHDFS